MQSDRVIYSTSDTDKLDIPQDAKTFFTEKGLPDSAAPFLSFTVSDAGPFPRVALLWPRAAALTDYAVIGSNGSGDPIAIALDGSGAIVYFNHDNRFQRVFMNSSAIQLDHCLNAYANLVSRTIETNGEDAYLDNNIPPRLIGEFEEIAIELDAEAMVEGCFWSAVVRKLNSGPYG